MTGYNALSLPISSDPKTDMMVGTAENGTPIYRNRLGVEYFIEAPLSSQPPPVENTIRTYLDSQGRSIHEEAPSRGPGLWDFVEGVGKNALNGLMQGITAPGRSMQEPVTNGDALATALDWGLLTAPASAPTNALRAGGLRDKYSAALRSASGGKDPRRIKLTAERVDAAKEYIQSTAQQRRAIAEAMRARQHRQAALEFAQRATRSGQRVRVKEPSGGSVYVRVGDAGTVRFADHPQPMEWVGDTRQVVGGFSGELGRRHQPASMSVDPESGLSFQDALSWLQSLEK